jgi:hypothetical protein
MPTNAIPAELATTSRLVKPLMSLNRCMGKNGSVMGMYDSNPKSEFPFSVDMRLDDNVTIKNQQDQSPDTAD